MTTTQRNPLPWILIFTTALTWQPLAAAEITARLSRSQINLGDTVQLSLEASVDLESPPDLSPLAPDFQIVGHQQSQNVQVLNGQRQTRLTLALQLLPHRSGSLTIPAISFGQDSTPPLALNVLDNRPSGDRLANELPAMMPGMSPAFPDRSMPPPSVLPPCQPDPVPPAASPPASPFWPVITILLALGWGWTLLAHWWQRRRLPAIPMSPIAVESPLATPAAIRAEITITPIQRALEGIHYAYQRQNPQAAHEALLAWAVLAWPNDPPLNLPRLAARCPEVARSAILRLDEALYSPSPIPWFEHSVWEMLQSVPG